MYTKTSHPAHSIYAFFRSSIYHVVYARKIGKRKNGRLEEETDNYCTTLSIPVNWIFVGRRYIIELTDISNYSGTSMLQTPSGLLIIEVSAAHRVTGGVTNIIRN